ncbi:carboxymuconolactone decarboxylase family protein [Castellaniella sp.]|uniref:carboxymuconolactone decarboxylase family protein n=1 Tax=Castellaniella sp. TaxID=1955812 RepID=UPI003C70D55B
MKQQDYGSLIQYVRSNLGPMRQSHPDVMKHFGALGKTALAPGALDARFKELIALAIAVATRCDDCIGFHTLALAKLGVDEQEILETLGVNVYMGGGPSLMYASHAISAFREFLPAQAITPTPA